MARMPLRAFVRAAVAGLILAGAASAFGAPARFDFDATPGHLPKDVVPQRYAIELDVDPARDDFTGRVRIELLARRPVRHIELHAHQLAAMGAPTLDKGRRALRVQRDPRHATWRLVPADGRPIAPGAHTLEIAYRGRVHTAAEGLYRAPLDGSPRAERMLATQLESIHARSLFPAFDEPAFRASFAISVRAPEGLEVVSNMPREPQGGEEAPGRAGTRLHRFAPTPPMPSYLVAIAVGRFDSLAGEVDGIPLRILTAPGKAAHGEHAMRATREVLPYFRNYFGIRYALPKLDQLAVPSTRRGAMEDWGLVSYMEPMLLFDPARSSPGTEREVYLTVAHELAHQWFGNLVTASSWDEIWLNEAFATWMEVKVTDRFNPAWQVPLHARRALDEAMTRDAGPATRPIRGQPVSEARVFDVFDEITYAKGGAVLSMLEQWLGPEVFQRGLAAYMQERRFSNATAGDLWHHLAEASGLDAAGLAASWTDRPGFPLVSVAAACREGRTEVTLAQARFSLREPLPAQRWRVPVRLQRGAQLATVLLEGDGATATLPGCDDGAPLVANAGGRGFYRVSYAPALRARLVAGFAELAAADQVAALSDSFALLLAGRLTLGEHFALLQRLPLAQGPGRAALFARAGEQLEALDDAFAGLPAQAALRRAARELLAPELARLGWRVRDDEDAESTALRGQLVARLARFDDAAVVAQALALYDADAAGVPGALAPSLRHGVVMAAGEHADAARFERLRAQLVAARSEEDRELYGGALAAGRDRQRARTLLDWALSGALPGHVATGITGDVGRRSPFPELAFAHARAHWPALARLAGTGAFNHSAWLLPHAAARLADPAAAELLVREQARRMGTRGAAAAAATAEAIRLRAAVREREAGAAEQVLARWRPAG